MEKGELKLAINKLQIELKVIEDREKYCLNKVGKCYKDGQGTVYKVISVEFLRPNVEMFTIIDLYNSQNNSFIKLKLSVLNNKDVEINALEFLSVYDNITNKITKTLTQ